MRLWLLPAAVCLAGCPKTPKGPAIPAAIQAVAPPPQSVEYTRINVAGDIELPQNRIREEWRGPSLSGELITYDVVTWDVTGGGQPNWLESVRHYFGSDGYGYLGTTDEDGTFTAWEPRQLVLPPDPKVGDTWSGTHQKGASTSERSCEILDSDYCPGGIVSVCDSRKDGGIIVLRDHFCPGVGWGGFEALVQTSNQPSIRMWSENLVKNDVEVPDPQPAEPEGDAPEGSE